MPEFVGVYLGPKAVSLAVVARQKRGLQIKAFSAHPYPEGSGDLAARAAFAARSVLDGGHVRLPVVVSISGAEIFLRPLTVPFTKVSHIAKTLTFELDGHVPFEMESAVTEFAVAGTGDKSSRLIVAAAARESIQAIASAFESAGLALRMITADVLAEPALGVFLGEGKYAIMEAGLDAWKLAVCERGRLVFARATAAVPPADKVETALGGWFKQSVAASRAETWPDRVFLVGSMAGSMDCEALSIAAGVQVSMLEVSAAVVDAAAVLDRGELVNSGIGALAAAAAGSCPANIIDLLSAWRGRRGPVDLIFVPAAAALVLVALLFGVFTGKYAGDFFAQKQRLEAAESEHLALWKQVFGEESPSGGVHAALKDKVNQAQQKTPEVALESKPVPLLRALFVLSRMQQSASGVQFRRFEARKGTVVLHASAASDVAATVLAKDIAAEGTFDAALQGVSNVEQGISFQILMTPRQ